MSSLLNPDGTVMQFITKIVYSVYLNILWLVCCLPVFTIGASTTALYYVSLKIVKNEEGNLTKAFFHSFRDNLKQGTQIWMILFGVGALLGVDGYVLYHMRFENAFWTLLTAVFIVAAVAYGIVLLYIFPLLAHFSNTTKAMLQNSLMIGMRFLLCTALMAVIYFAMLYVIINVCTPMIIFGQGTCALLCSWLLSNILVQCEERTEEESPAEENSEI